jgi:hypothetical protein
MSFKSRLLRFMVWNMRWMTRHLSFVARPMVRTYANFEVIACGLHGRDGHVSIIYTPTPGRTDHHARVYDRRRWLPAESAQAANFSGAIVHRVLIPKARIGARYRMFAKTRLGWSISSPMITIKKVTIYEPELLRITPSSDGSVAFSWHTAEAYDSMIYFLAIEDMREIIKAAVYTRESSWTYPRVKKASLSLGPAQPPRLTGGEMYVAKLVLIDYEGWVTHIAERSFTTADHQ